MKLHFNFVSTAGEHRIELSEMLKRLPFFMFSPTGEQLVSAVIEFDGGSTMPLCEVQLTDLEITHFDHYAPETQSTVARAANDE
ncbi:MAG TPA: hypothetical protein VIE69_06925 [Methylophilaceae bacterium]|jgi:hypothetical protein